MWTENTYVLNMKIGISNYVSTLGVECVDDYVLRLHHTVSRPNERITHTRTTYNLLIRMAYINISNSWYAVRTAI